MRNRFIALILLACFASLGPSLLVIFWNFTYFESTNFSPLTVLILNMSTASLCALLTWRIMNCFSSSVSIFQCTASGFLAGLLSHPMYWSFFFGMSLVRRNICPDHEVIIRILVMSCVSIAMVGWSTALAGMVAGWIWGLIFRCQERVIERCPNQVV